jgi:hypothetical protein
MYFVSHCIVIVLVKQMNIKQYLDSTYLKTASQAGINESQNMLVAKSSFKKPLMKLQAYYDSV